MTKRIPEPRAELSPGIRAHEARLLATMLRTSRLTWVFGEPGTDKSALLKAGVLPLLQRRGSDRGLAAMAASSPAYCGAERRARLAGTPARPTVEAAIYFDSWGAQPMADLLARVDALAATLGQPPARASRRFAETLHDLYRASGLRIVFLLDRFEEFLTAPVDRDGAAAFAAELVAATLDPDLPASFLIALDEVARPRLERFRARIPGFDHNSLRLSPVARPADTGSAEQLPGGVEQTLPIANGAAASEVGRTALPLPAAGLPRRVIPRPRPKHLRGPPPREPVKVDDVYALIEQTLSRTVAPPPAAAPERRSGPLGGSADESRAPLATRGVAAARPVPGAGPGVAQTVRARGGVDPPPGPAATGAPIEESAQKALGTFRLAAALGRLRYRRSDGG
ncbi:MAG: hypothetical protein J0L57_02340 [Burkholderiales bacterium]|nr:hypothetical protein [Burkholderiales bacterium]